MKASIRAVTMTCEFCGRKFQVRESHAAKWRHRACVLKVNGVEKVERLKEYKSPCGAIMKPSEETPRGSFCTICEKYIECLSVAAHSDWPGWRLCYS